MEWMILPLKRYATFRGRARRKEFWLWVLFIILVSVALSAVDHALGLGGAGPYAYGPTTPSPGGPRAGVAAGAGAGFRGGLLTGLFSLAVLLPNIAVQVRRLHDVDRTGWWLLLPVIPYLVGLGCVIAGAVAGALGLAGIGVAAMVAGLIGAVVLLVWFCLDGTRGPNRFGEDPKRIGADLGDVFA